MQTIHITRIYRGEQETKNGKLPKIGIKCTEYGDKWLSSFDVRGTEEWKDGDAVTVSIEENGKYVNFRQIKKEDSAVAVETTIAERVKWLENRVGDIEKYLKVKQEKDALEDFNNA